MNIRSHSDNCLQGKMCIRCYKKAWWDSQTEEVKAKKLAYNKLWNKNNKNKPKTTSPRNLPREEEWVTTQQLKGRLNYLNRYALKKDDILRVNSQWRKSNPTKTRALRAKYRAAKLRATPAWADLKEIEEFYAKCPKGYEVDHIIPLQGDNVCGLHVHYNLQFLSRSENRSKSNKMKEG